MKQKTIKDIIKISGFGIHTGVKTNVILKPAKEDNGIVFIRSDIESKPKIKALVQNVFSTERSTNLKQNNAEIRTVEHLLAAIAGSEIDNLNIEVDNIEIPILDGSSKKYSELISKIGTVDLNKEKKIFEIKRRISIVDKDTGTHNFQSDKALIYSILCLPISPHLPNAALKTLYQQTLQDVCVPCDYPASRHINLIYRHTKSEPAHIVAVKKKNSVCFA